MKTELTKTEIRKEREQREKFVRKNTPITIHRISDGTAERVL